MYTHGVIGIPILVPTGLNHKVVLNSSLTGERFSGGGGFIDLKIFPFHHHLGLLFSENLSWINFDFIDNVVNIAFKKTWPSKKKNQVQNWHKKLIEILYNIYQTYA